MSAGRHRRGLHFGTLVGVMMTILLSQPILDSPSNATAVPNEGIDFVEIRFQSGQDMEARWPRVGEEFRIVAKVRNSGAVRIYFLLSLCDTSLSAFFDSYHVRVETDRPRCLAVSMSTPLEPGQEATVWAPESGTAYIAIREGSTKAIVVFSYNLNSGMGPSTQRQAQSIVNLTIQGSIIAIGGFPIESIAIGLTIAFALVFLRKRLDALLAIKVRMQIANRVLALPVSRENYLCPRIALGRRRVEARSAAKVCRCFTSSAT